MSANLPYMQDLYVRDTNGKLETIKLDKEVREDGTVLEEGGIVLFHVSDEPKVYLTKPCRICEL